MLGVDADKFREKENRQFCNTRLVASARSGTGVEKGMDDTCGWLIKDAVGDSATSNNPKPAKTNQSKV